MEGLCQQRGHEWQVILKELTSAKSELPEMHFLPKRPDERFSPYGLASVSKTKQVPYSLLRLESQYLYSNFLELCKENGLLISRLNMQKADP
jgi:hypothetical protein